MVLFFVLWLMKTNEKVYWEQRKLKMLQKWWVMDFVDFECLILVNKNLKNMNFRYLWQYAFIPINKLLHFNINFSSTFYLPLLSKQYLITPFHQQVAYPSFSPTSTHLYPYLKSSLSITSEITLLDSVWLSIIQTV